MRDDRSTAASGAIEGGRGAGSGLGGLWSWVQIGVRDGLSPTDAKYVQFVNIAIVTMLVTALGGLLNYLVAGQSQALPVQGASVAVQLLALAFNARGQHLVAKVVCVLGIFVGMVGSAWLVGADHPAHRWVMVAGLVTILAFRADERAAMFALLGLGLLLFGVLEVHWQQLEPQVRLWPSEDAKDAATHVANIGLVLTVFALAAAMHGRFGRAEVELESERARAEGLLHAILPVRVAERLKREPEVLANEHADVSVLFADMVGFTPMAARMPARALVLKLNAVFRMFDRRAAELGLEKIKTIGDAYMVAGGVPEPFADHHAAMAEMALSMLELVAEHNAATDEPIALRIGVHCGPLIAGVVGSTKFSYDLWGETVNVAARLESASAPGRVLVSGAFAARLGGSFVTEPCGTLELKGVGAVEGHWLAARDVTTSRRA